MSSRILIILLSLIMCTACSQAKKKFESPAGYDFNRPVTYKMPEELLEISGISFYPGNKDTMYAIQDEEGKIFYWKNGKPDIVTQAKFGKHGDFEDVAITKSHTFVLRSDGTLFGFPITEVKEGNIKSVQEWKDLVPVGEYESLYADAAENDLYILCKNCGADKKEGTVSGYILHLNESGQPSLKSNFKLNIGDGPQLTTLQKSRLRPSAMAFNNRTNEWYVVSSVNKMLIIADKTWKMKQVIHLNSKLFPQPEGISFDIDNNLYISNEAGNTSAGTVLKFLFENTGGQL